MFTDLTNSQYFPHQNFLFSYISYLATADEFVAICMAPLKINYISEAPPRVALYTATAQGLLWFLTSHSQ